MLGCRAARRAAASTVTMLSTIRSAAAAISTARGPNAATVTVVPSGGWRRRNPSTRSPASNARTSPVAFASRSTAPRRSRPCQAATTSLDVPRATWARRPIAATVAAARAIWAGERTVTASGPSTGSIRAVRATTAAAIAGASSLAISPTHTSP